MAFILLCPLTAIKTHIRRQRLASLCAYISYWIDTYCRHDQMSLGLKPRPFLSLQLRGGIWARHCKYSHLSVSRGASPPPVLRSNKKKGRFIVQRDLLSPFRSHQKQIGSKTMFFSEILLVPHSLVRSRWRLINRAWNLHGVWWRWRRVCDGPTFHSCCAGLPGHLGSHPGCSLQSAAPAAGCLFLGRSSKFRGWSQSPRELAPTARNSTRASTQTTAAHKEGRYRWGRKVTNKYWTENPQLPGKIA